MFYAFSSSIHFYVFFCDLCIVPRGCLTWDPLSHFGFLPARSPPWTPRDQAELKNHKLTRHQWGEILCGFQGWLLQKWQGGPSFSLQNSEHTWTCPWLHDWVGSFAKPYCRSLSSDGSETPWLWLMTHDYIHQWQSPTSWNCGHLALKHFKASNQLLAIAAKGARHQERDGSNAAFCALAWSMAIIAHRCW